MRIDYELLDKEILSEHFSLSSLWIFKEKIEFIKIELEEQLDRALELELVSESLKVNQQIIYVSLNLAAINSVFNKKREGVLIDSYAGEYCVN
jgi:hypothetical protein